MNKILFFQGRLGKKGKWSVVPRCEKLLAQNFLKDTIISANSQHSKIRSFIPELESFPYSLVTSAFRA